MAPYYFLSINFPLIIQRPIRKKKGFQNTLGKGEKHFLLVPQFSFYSLKAKQKSFAINIICRLQIVPILTSAKILSSGKVFIHKNMICNTACAG